MNLRQITIKDQLELK